jgi:site-specific DNA recombinase
MTHELEGRRNEPAQELTQEPGVDPGSTSGSTSRSNPGLAPGMGSGTGSGLGFGDDVSVLSWMASVAEQSTRDGADDIGDVPPTVIPVAWVGRTSTEDQQDPTLSLPRQLENSRAALPAPFVIVAKFYDVESGRKDLDLRGRSDAHERLDIPIPRDGGIADLLAEAARPERRFVAVVCESIDRVARVSYFSTKIEHELERVGVPLLAADEGIDPARVLPATDGGRPKRATQILTRRIKQAISEWYVVNLLELSWDGFREHTRQGWNIGKPPYGYLADRQPHPVKTKRAEGKTKTRLIPDPVRGPVVTQIFRWRGLERISAGDIAHRLNTDPDRYPPPQPAGKRPVGAWTTKAVLDILANPKYTGYMVWNRRKRGSRARGVVGKVNPPTEWVWSPQPTHEPLTTRKLFHAAAATKQVRERSRSAPGPNLAHPQTKRSYLLRSYLFCDLCQRRMGGKTHTKRGRDYLYYTCSTNPAHHHDRPWYPHHPKNIFVREDRILPVIGDFFAERILGPSRHLFLPDPTTPTDTPDPDAEAEAAALRTRLDQLRRAQDNLFTQLETFQPTGDPDIDDEWRQSLQRRFAALANERRTLAQRLTDLTRPAAPPEPELDPRGLLAQIPCTTHDLTALPEPDQRQLYDAFHLQARYHHEHRHLTLRVTINASTVHDLAAMITNVTGRQNPAGEFSHLVRDPGSTRLVEPLRGEAEVGGQPAAVVGRVAEQGRRRVGALEVPVRRVLPGEADAAVQLDGLGGHGPVGLRAVGLGQRRQQGSVGGVPVPGGRGRERRRSRRLDQHEQVREPVLDRLERPDRAPELHPGRHVLDGQLQAPLGAADLVRRHRGGGQVGQPRGRPLRTRR